ncbi:MAG: peptidylprolyl isomerase [Anaerolineae bacterium]|nr:peptidylprolyl isomerase [Anaerolineae bacterium]
MNNGDDIRIIYRHFPLITIHDKAQITAEAAEAAGAQDKFWEMHDKLFEKQQEWSSTPADGMVDVLVGYAEEVGVDDIDKFRSDLENGTYSDKVMADYQAAAAAGLAGTPSFVVNQLDYPTQSLGLSYEALSLFTKMMLLKLRNHWQWYQQPEQVIDLGKEYIATIQTVKGDIVVELFPDTAPVNVNSFVFLANRGWYKDVTFHRVLPGFVAQGGDPTGLGFGFPGYRCSDEVTPERSFDGAGMVALANSGPNTNGGQFFITYNASPNLNDGFTIIGRVIEGQDIAESITPRDPQVNPAVPPGDKIIDITVEEK